jgi:hypothetical protein
MKRIVHNLNDWLKEITVISEKFAFNMNHKNNKLKPMDIFIGLTDDTVSSLVYKFSKENKYLNILSEGEYYGEDESSYDSSINHVEDLTKQVKEYLLQCCTSDGIIRLLNSIYVNMENKKKPIVDINSIIDTYFNQQSHDSFSSFFSNHLSNLSEVESNFIQITTHSKLLSKKNLKQFSNLNNIRIKIESLLSFDTQQQFIQVLKEFYESNLNETKDETVKNILIIQCDCAHFYQELINCARFTIIDEYSKYSSQNMSNFSIMFIIQVPKIAGGCINGFQTSKWLCYHIDDLQNVFSIDNLLNFKDKSLSEIFSEALNIEHDSKNKNFLFLISLLKSMVFVSCSKIIDPSKNSINRSIERIDFLLTLFEQNTFFSVEFCKILLKYLTKLQQEREFYTSNSNLSKKWIFNEVSRISNVIKFGTLKNSCINYMETRLMNLFAGIVAFIDTNKNLNLLINSKREWISKFWLHVFADQEIVSFNFKSMFEFLIFF